MALRQIVGNSKRIRTHLNYQKTISTSITAKEDRLRIRDWNINYIKVGTGPRVLLCVPGGVGTIWTDFGPQIEGLDRNKITIVAYDPPGYGKSRPPEKDYSGNFYKRESDIIGEFMQMLNIPKYSLLGWSAGSAISMIHAAKFPDAVEKLIVVGAHSYITARDFYHWDKLNNSSEWSQQFSDAFQDIYGKETLRVLWKNLIDGIECFKKSSHGNICKDLLKDIRCPTYVVYGEKDKLIEPSHVLYLKSNIKDSRIHLYPEGKHNIHLRYSDDFNKRLQDFLTDEDCNKLI